MTDQDIRHALIGDRSWCLRQLKGCALEDWRAVLAAEQVRRRPRTRLVATLRQCIAQREDWACRLARLNSELARRELEEQGVPMAWQEAKAKAQELYDELLAKHDHGFVGMVLDAMQRLHTRAKPKRPPLPDNRPPETGDRR